MIRYRRQRWLTADGRTLVAPLPIGVQDHFGPELHRFVLVQHHQGQVTTERITAFLSIFLGETTQNLGLVGQTQVWGYGNADDPDGQPVTYPGRTFLVDSKVPITVIWENQLPEDVHLLDRNGTGTTLDTSLHWADPATGRPSGNTIDQVGPPIVTHVHGGQNLSNFDGLPEYWYTPDTGVSQDSPFAGS